MARLARVVVPGPPHHVTQRGHRRGPVFFEAEDYQFYRRMIPTAARAARRRRDLSLLPDAQSPPSDRDAADSNALRRTFGEAKRTAATPRPSTRFRWTGDLFQCRFGAVVMDEPHRLAAARHIARDPVVAGLVRDAGDWPWSSARAHLAGEDDELATVAPLRALIPDFAALLAAPADPATTARIEQVPTIGRPLGAPEWIAALERRLGPLARGRPGPNPRADRAPQRQQRLL